MPNVALLAVALVVQAPESPAGRFQLEAADQAAAARFVALTADCGRETRIFASILAEIDSASVPLPTRVVVNEQAVLYGNSHDPATRRPLFTIDLHDIERFPMLGEVRRAATALDGRNRCQVLARELAAAVQYRRLFNFWKPTTMPFTDRIEIARGYGQLREELVAKEQKTRHASSGGRARATSAH